MSVARYMLMLGICAAAPGLEGCGLLLDSAYAISSKGYHETVQERRPTDQAITAVEYDAALGQAGKVSLACEERERRVERAFTVDKTFRYRGSFEGGTYTATAVLSGLFGAVAAVTTGAICLRDPQPPSTKKVSCMYMLIATPFALDVGWSILRASTAKPAKLVDKKTSEATLALAETPTKRTAVSCETAAQQIMLGYVVGPSDTDALNGRGDGQKPHLGDGALPVVMGEGGLVSLADQPAIVHAWGQNDSLALWVVDREGSPHPLKLDRCTVLRPLAAIFTPEEQVLFQRSCPLPPPAPMR